MKFKKKKNIGAFAQKQKDARHKSTITRRREHLQQLEKNLEKIVMQRWKEAPKVLYNDFKILIGNDQSSWPSDLPTVTTEDNVTSLDMKKITAIISSIKQKIKKDGKRCLLN